MWRIDKLMKKRLQTQKGFTLLELLLVIAIMSGIMVMVMRGMTQKIDETRRDRVVVQVQQILNSALSYYIGTGRWPVKNEGVCKGDADKSDLSTLIRAGYLTGDFKHNPYGQAYGFQVSCNPTTNNFYVETWFPNSTEAGIVAGRLPLAEIHDKVKNDSVRAGVNIPGQNINNARAYNFGNLYHSGACVPAPVCPNNMKQQIVVIPVSVSGLNETSSSKIYPISSFTAYAYGAPGNPPDPNPVMGGKNVATCNNYIKPTPCSGHDSTIPPQPSDGKIDDNTAYWRVCLNVVTAKGNTNPDNKPNENFAKNVTVLAITRCGPPSEPVGSDFTVFLP